MMDYSQLKDNTQGLYFQQDNLKSLLQQNTQTDTLIVDLEKKIKKKNVEKQGKQKVQIRE